jgi:hypothetical protein
MAHKFKSFIVILLSLTLSGITSSSAQDFDSTFGKAKETILKRKLAPYVAIKNKRIKIIAEAQGNTQIDVANVLKTKFVTDVQKDLGYVVDDSNPETILRFTVTAFDVEQRQGTRQSGNSTTTFTLINGNVEVSYQALEAKTNAPLDSENLIENINAEYPPSPSSTGWFSKRVPIPMISGSQEIAPSAAQIKSALINSVVKQMAQRAAPIEERFTVKLPRGKLQQLSNVAMTHSWGKVMDGAMQMAPFPKEKDDSYRIYLIGLANEALAYDENNSFDKTRNYLFEARKYYDEARAKHPGENDYIEPWTRVDKAVTQYDKIKMQGEQYRQFLATKSGKPTPTPAPNLPRPDPVKPPENTDASKKLPSTPANDDVWTNETVLKFLRMGISEQDLIGHIKNAPKHSFQVSAPGDLMKLYEAKVPSAVIRAMQAKSKPASAPPPKPKPRAAGGTKKP